MLGFFPKITMPRLSEIAESGHRAFICEGRISLLASHYANPNQEDTIGAQPMTMTKITSTGMP